MKFRKYVPEKRFSDDLFPLKASGRTVTGIGAKPSLGSEAETFFWGNPSKTAEMKNQITYLDRVTVIFTNEGNISWQEERF